MKMHETTIISPIKDYLKKFSIIFTSTIEEIINSDRKIFKETKKQPGYVCHEYFFERS